MSLADEYEDSKEPKRSAIPKKRTKLKPDLDCNEDRRHEALKAEKRRKQKIGIVERRNTLRGSWSKVFKNKEWQTDMAFRHPKNEK